MFVNSPNDFRESSNRCRCTFAYSAIPTTLASVETNQEIMIFMDKKKKRYSGPVISGKTKELRLFSRNERLKASTEVKENHAIVN